MRQIFHLCLLIIASTATFSHAKTPSLIQGMDAIYGIDDREFITDKSDPAIKKLSQSVALIVSADNVRAGLFKTTIEARPLKEEQQQCIDERFSDRPALTGCTGFLIAPDLLLTARHCFELDEDCAQKKIIFDAVNSKASSFGYSVPNKDVFNCKKIVARGLSIQEDFAILKLDRVVKGRLPLKLNTKKKTDSAARVFMIGHPFGVPLMLSRRAPINNNENTFQFLTSLDSFQGNSGSPVINSRTLLVEGILVNGQQDLVQDSQNECYRNSQYNTAGLEGVFRASKLPAF